MAYDSGAKKPILQVDDSGEAARARELLEAHDVDYEVGETTTSGVSLEWNSVVYQGFIGVADFVMFVGRLPLPGVRKPGRPGDGRLPGEPVPLGERERPEPT